MRPVATVCSLPPMIVAPMRSTRESVSASMIAAEVFLTVEPIVSPALPVSFNVPEFVTGATTMRALVAPLASMTPSLPLLSARFPPAPMMPAPEIVLSTLFSIVVVPNKLLPSTLLPAASENAI
jgi:hypothetical protein